MARRRKSGIGGASMDSLLDTMTNVVGILVIMLVVTQLGVQDAVKRITGYLTEEELAEKQQASQDLDHLLDLELDRKQVLEEADPEIRRTLEQQQALIAEYEKRIAEIEDARLDPERLQRELGELRKQEGELATKVEERTAEIASLRARLAETPAGPDPEAKIVNLPNPRPAPPRSEPVEFLVRHGRVYPLPDVVAFQQRAMAEINAARTKVDLARDPEDPDRLRVDGAKLKAHFDDKLVGDRNFRIRIHLAGNGKPELVIDPRETGGFGERDLPVGLGRIVRQNENLPRFLRFRVFADSFSAYLEARVVADRFDVPAGWIPYAKEAEYRVGLGNKVPILVAGYTPPPPRPAPPPDPTAPPPPPPPPKSDVD